MYCFNCGGKNTEDKNYCSYCGKPLNNQERGISASNDSFIPIKKLIEEE